MALLTVNLPNRPFGEVTEIQGDGWRAVCVNGESVEVPDLEEPMSLPPINGEEEEVVITVEEDIDPPEGDE